MVILGERKGYSDIVSPGRRNIGIWNENNVDRTEIMCRNSEDGIGITISEGRIKNMKQSRYLVIMLTEGWKSAK